MRSGLFSEIVAQGKLSFEDKHKYLSIHSLQMEAFVFIVFQIFFVTYAVLKIGECHSVDPQF